MQPPRKGQYVLQDKHYQSVESGPLRKQRTVHRCGSGVALEEHVYGQDVAEPGVHKAVCQWKFLGPFRSRHEWREPRHNSYDMRRWELLLWSECDVMLSFWKRRLDRQEWGGDESQPEQDCVKL